MHIIKNEKGLSLLELIMGIVIVSIVIISFFSLLIQSNKTTATSDKIMDATYQAQTEFEKIYALRDKNESLKNLLLCELGYQLEDPTAPSLISCGEVSPFNGSDTVNKKLVINDSTGSKDIIFEKEFVYKKGFSDTTYEFTYLLTVHTIPALSPDVNSPMYNFILTVTNKHTNSSSTMETVYQIGDNL